MGTATEAPGTLILVAGPSGSGKDTLISAARRTLDGNSLYVFPLRFITRSDQTGEEHVYLSRQDFARFRRQGLFFLDWDAHGFSYGIPITVERDLSLGRTVVFNISRKLIPAARQNWPRTEVVALRVDPLVLMARLRQRGRETEAEIEKRVRRAGDPACGIEEPVHTLDNSGGLDESVRSFLDLLHRLGRSVPTAPEPFTGQTRT